MMSILNQLSSQMGDRTEYSNRKVAIQCLADPDLLVDIASGLRGSNPAIVGDCAEVMTKVAEADPEWVVPYVEDLAPLLIHKNTRVRWEAVHALSLITTFVPGSISPLLTILMEMIGSDTSVIARDYATDTIANFASTSRTAAEAAFPLLKETLIVWGSKHAHHALKGLVHVATLMPEHRPEIRLIAEDFSHSIRGVVRKAAKELQTVLDSLMKTEI